MRVLLADDSAVMRKIIIRALNAVGVDDIVEVGDGDAALEAYSPGAFEAVLTDWNMPGMTGIDLLRNVRADDNLKTLPVLMVTAEAKRDQIVAAAQAGVNGYVVKPFTAAVLKEKIEKIFERIDS